jgi:cytochrome c553
MQAWVPGITKITITPTTISGRSTSAVKKQPFNPFRTGVAKQAFDPALAAEGATLQQEQCESCHEQGGVVAGRGPRLAGQWMPYLKSSLKFVPTGEHLVPPAMEKKVAGETDTEINAILNFYASQQD